jgi:hypothetical protein
VYKLVHIEAGDFIATGEVGRRYRTCECNANLDRL